jgi:hypothetical protein
VGVGGKAEAEMLKSLNFKVWLKAFGDCYCIQKRILIFFDVDLKTLDELIAKILPKQIAFNKDMNLSSPMSELFFQIHKQYIYPEFQK